MLSLNPASVCDVCAEEYSPRRPPHCIPCGHVLCASCCNTIVAKTPTRLTPVCPFCRENFNSDTIRLIRIDFTSSGWSTPRHRGGTLEANINDLLNDYSIRKDGAALGAERSRAEARRLEDKVAKVAAKKCSVEEVTTLHKELQEWLTSEVNPDDQMPSLSLSAALLRAILMNHLAHSEASKNAKTVEVSLKAKIEGMETENEKLESELRRQKSIFAQKSQECQSLRVELSRTKAKAMTPALSVPISSTRASALVSPQRPQSASSVFRAPTTPPTPSHFYSPTAQSPLSRYGSVHSRSASMSIRSETPALHRPKTPPSPTPRPPVPPKPRTLSSPAPPKMMRSVSDETEKMHQRWLPSINSDEHGPPKGKPAAYSAYPVGVGGNRQR